VRRQGLEPRTRGLRVRSFLCYLVPLVLASPNHGHFVPVDGKQRAVWSHPCCPVYGVRAPTEHPSNGRRAVGTANRTRAVPLARLRQA